MTNSDSAIRQAAFRWLAMQAAMHDDVIPRNILTTGFEYQGQRVALLGPKGIFKPKIMDLPISIATIPSGPYDDGYSENGQLMYKYRGTDPKHPDNVGLRRLMTEKIPLIYFYRLDKGRYLATWPVFIIHDQPDKLTFTVAVDDVHYLPEGLVSNLGTLAVADDPEVDARRRYITATVRQRVHQRSFRVRVLNAYQTQCAMCRLRHEELLDAAHIIPDTDPEGEPVISNGLALCKLHHAAYDRNFLAVKPDYTIEVRQTILDETDGPMLLHGLKEMHDNKILLPTKQKHWPDVSLLERRYRDFLSEETGTL